MKINETQRIGAINSYQAKSEQRTEANGRKRQSDQVHISAEALEMLSHNRADQAERAKKIDGLKQQVATGSYFVDNGKLAEKLLPFFK
ncbi:flagellar biosynthesis anti-sigma factor FlgM [Cohnella mopanensis]|uniref:flagellar biosynthesis anti-sigma factor FlgM n=1 Tax=Cohnella mopanensis TaxID=2911966 RepID=UPI001EF905A2